MAKIIRCKLPDGIHRFEPFTVSDYRDFLLVRNDMMHKEESEQKELVNELAADYFGEFPSSIQKYIFLSVFTGSIGKSKIPISYECPICGKVQKRLFNISMENGLSDPELVIDENTSITFKFPDKEYDDPTRMIMDSINSITHNGEKYLWTDLDESTQSSIIDMIDFTKFEYLVKKLKPIYFELKLKCCEDTTIIYDDLYSIFNLLINPDEVFPFYEINHILVKNKYDWDSVMNMLPSERSIALALIERDNKK